MKDKEKQDILVSVIIPCYNRVDGLRQLLERLSTQECEFKYEVIAVDDGSQNPILPQISDLIEKSPIPIYCLRKKNGGPASARNLGVEIAKGEYLILVDDDMIIEPNFIQAHVETQQAVGNGLISCIFEFQIEGKTAPFHNWYNNRTTEWREGFKKGLKKFSEDIFIPASPTNLTTANLSVRKSDYISLGKLDSEYENPATEDQDFALRAQKNNIGAYITFKTKAIQKESYDSLRKVCQRQMRGAKDTVRFVKRFSLIGDGKDPHIAKEYGWIELGKDSIFTIGKKLLRSLINLPVISSLCFNIVEIMEKIMPNSNILRRVYNLIVSSYTQKGWRDGLKYYADVEPLPGWEKTVKV